MADCLSSNRYHLVNAVVHDVPLGSKMRFSLHNSCLGQQVVKEEIPGGNEQQ